MINYSNNSFTENIINHIDSHEKKVELLARTPYNYNFTRATTAWSSDHTNVP